MQSSDANNIVRSKSMVSAVVTRILLVLSAASTTAPAEIPEMPDPASM